MQIADDLLSQLFGGAENFNHTHPDKILDSNDRYNVNKSMTVTEVSTTPYSATRNDELLLVDTSAASVTITFPAAADGKEYQVTKIEAPNRVIIVPTGTDTLAGATQVNIFNQWTSLRFKAVTGGYILL